MFPVTARHLCTKTRPAAKKACTFFHMLGAISGQVSNHMPEDCCQHRQQGGTKPFFGINSPEFEIGLMVTRAQRSAMNTRNWKFPIWRVRQKSDVLRILLSQRFQNRPVFIHINKCGGTSIERALDIPKVHDDALTRRRRIGRRAWQRNYTFSIVRHPFSKVCSHYEYRVRTNQTGLGDRHLDLNSWIRETYGQRNPRYFDKPLMFAPCADWLRNGSGNIIVDEVFRLERIREAWPIIKRRAAIDQPLEGRNSTFRFTPAKAASLIEPQLLRLVEQHFDADFDLFGYQRASEISNSDGLPKTAREPAAGLP